jgi:hypothetical protein
MKDDLLALPAAIRSFNGSYTVRGKFMMMNSMRILVAEAVLAGAVLVALVWIPIRETRTARRTSKNILTQFPAFSASGLRHSLLKYNRENSESSPSQEFQWLNDVNCVEKVRISAT